MRGWYLGLEWRYYDYVVSFDGVYLQKISKLKKIPYRSTITSFDISLRKNEACGVSCITK